MGTEFEVVLGRVIGAYGGGIEEGSREKAQRIEECVSELVECELYHLSQGVVYKRHLLCDARAASRILPHGRHQQSSQVEVLLQEVQKLACVRQPIGQMRQTPAVLLYRTHRISLRIQLLQILLPLFLFVSRFTTSLLPGIFLY